MAVTQGMDSISIALKKQFEKATWKYVDEEENGREATLDTRIFSSACRVLETRVEFEASQVQSYTVLSNLKGKYKVLLPPKMIQIDKVSATSTKIVKNFQTDKRYVSEESSKRINAKPPLLDSPVPQTPSVELFPETGVKLGWQGNEPVGAGMINLGNTCYLNSTLQALFHVPSFSNWLASENQHNGIGKCEQAFISGDMCLICAMASTLRITRNHSGNVMKPVLIYGRLKSICKHLSHGHQEDAHEFLRFLIEGMEKCFLLRYKGKKLDNSTKETTPLHRIFGGYLRNEVVCHSCGKISTTFQLFQDLFLDIRHTNSLKDSMQAFFSRERLEGDDRNDSYKCEQCKRKGNCSKRVYIQAPPKVLCVQLKRFTAMGKKIMKHISYPLKLDLSPYVYMKTVNKNGDVISPLPKVRRPIPYKLMSLVTHYGSAMNCGHYTAVGRSAKGTYFTFDDSLVRPASMNSALDSCAYILMYEMEPGWNIGLGENNGERVNSVQPSKSLPDLTRFCSPQTSVSKSTFQSEDKSNSLIEVRPSQHSKMIQLDTASSKSQEGNLESAKFSLSYVAADRLTPAVPKPETVMSSTSSSVQNKIMFNGILNRKLDSLTSKHSPSAASSPKHESNSSHVTPNQNQDISNVIRQIPSQSSSEVKVKKDDAGSMKESDSGFKKEPESKSSKLSSTSLHGNGKRKSTANNESKEIPPNEIVKGVEKRITAKRKLSSSCSEDNQQSRCPLKRQLTLPDLINRKNAANSHGALETPRPKIKTLKDWLEVRSSKKGDATGMKGPHKSKVLSQSRDVISTVSGWKVTDQKVTPSNHLLDKKDNALVLKRKKGVITTSGEKKKKLDPSENAQLWRTFFKNKIMSEKSYKKLGGQANMNNKVKEDSDVDCASKPSASIGSHTLFQKV